jgi:hypothetical protein
LLYSDFSLANTPEGVLQEPQIVNLFHGPWAMGNVGLVAAILIMTAAIGIQIGIGTEIDEKARNSTPIAIAISISTVRMCHN